VIREIDDLYERFEFAKVATTLYHFAWDEVCDWYVELAKVTLPGPRGDVTRRVLGEVLDVLLRLLHPLMPFVTEVLWTTLTGRESIVIAPWPIAEPTWTDGAAEAQIARVQAVVSEGRRFRADQGLKPSARIPARITGLVDGVTEARWLLRLDEPDASFQPTASVTVPGGVLVEVDLSGAIDVTAERARYAKDLSAAFQERDKTAAKLANPSFAEKAPGPVVAKTRDRLLAAESDIARIEAALAALPTG